MMRAFCNIAPGIAVMSDNPVLERAHRFLMALRHCQVLGLCVHEATPQGLTLRLPYSTQIIGKPETGVIHGGAITTLMDTAMGMAVPVAIGAFEMCPTLDLRIDYMGSAEPKQAVFGRAEIYRITDNVVFARGWAYQDDSDRPIARCLATFMRLGKHLKESKQ